MQQQNMKLVAVVVPLSNRNEFTPEENISLRHLMNFLGKYDKYFVIPESLQIEYPGFLIKRFNDRFFGSLRAHTKLMLSPKFYKSFIDYEYILIYHLDSLVFSDQLEQWCQEGFDYIGAPWIKHGDAPYAGMPGNENKVGNGGFSLRKVRSFLEVLNSPRYCVEPSTYWKTSYGLKSKGVQFFNLPKKILKYLKFFNNARWEISRYPYNEEHFWANRATHYYPGFNIAPLEIALRFAFECVPQFCFEKNNYTLPFGCHAWHKYGREFWEPYLIQ
jgi:hypothetical protein